LCRAQLARGRDTHALTRAGLGLALTLAGCPDEAMAATDGLIEAAEATRNPLALSYALFAAGLAFRDADPDHAREALRRALVIVQESGNRANETNLTITLGRHEALYGDPLAALEYSAVAFRNYHDAGDTANMRTPLAVLAALFDRLGRYEPAATIAGFAISPIITAAVPEFSTAIAHLRQVLGDQPYESLAHAGESMITTAMATYAYDQIDQARAELEHPS
jgi:tetratricopeptide (TPR) repeat protein